MNVMQPVVRVRGAVHDKERHESGHKHVSGTAEYIDDIPEPAGTLHGYLGLSQRAHAEILSVNFEAVHDSPGVVGVLTAQDIPGENDISPAHKHDDPVFATGRVEFHGQPIFAVIATSREAARRAAAKVKIDYRDLPHVTDVLEAAAANYPLVIDPLKLERGDIDAGFAKAKNIVSGEMRIGGQDHFYLEGQISFAIPGEDDEVTVFSSTQHPSETQLMVAHVLGVPSNAVTVNVRRMGGGFGGKETQANLFAAVAAVAARKYRRAVKVRPDRDDDMAATGKRHDFHVDYKIGFDDDGRIEAVDAVFAARCGFSADLSGPVTDRALFHADNCYFYPNVRLRSRPLKTNTVSNTAFRGFGGPQGMVGGERMIEDVAYALGKDPLEIRKLNFYGGEGRNLTPYHQTVEDNIIGRIIEELETSSDYAARRKAIIAFNRENHVIKRGIALTPVKFGISFTKTEYNQAGALIHVYTDGSIQLNHGGTEMGQGLYTKVAQVVADEFQVDLDHIKVTATSTGKVPNTSATAASSGSDLNGMAAANACQQIKERLVRFAAERYGVSQADVAFEPNTVRIGAERIPFADLIKAAYAARVQLSAAGFYKTSEDPLEPRRRAGPAFLLLRLRRLMLRGQRRHADRRIPGRTNGHHSRRRQVAEPCSRPRPGRRCLRPGHGLADDRGTLVGCQGPAADARAIHLQDPARVRSPARLQRASGRLVGEPGGDDPALEGGRGTSLHARHFGSGGDIHGGGKRCGLSYSAAHRCTRNTGARSDGCRAPARRPGRLGTIAQGR